YRLALEAAAVDEELSLASDKHLNSMLADHPYWVGGSSYHRNQLITPRYRDDGTIRPTFAWQQTNCEAWVEENIPETQRDDALRLLARRAELREAIIQAEQEFWATRKEIKETLRKSRIVEAAQRLDATAGTGVSPELELANVAGARALVGVLSSALDETYMKVIDERPQLAALDAAGATRVAAATSTDIEP
ncbi:MAG: hypothetical protein ACRDHE_11225, partial [Ktedonobacterales bacterium]